LAQDRPQDEVAAWLSVVLGQPPPAACDSAVVAGVIELLRTQGLWAESMRRAWAFELLASFEEITPTAAAAAGGDAAAAGFPRLSEFDELVEICESSFLRVSKGRRRGVFFWGRRRGRVALSRRVALFGGASTHPDGPRPGCHALQCR